MEQPHTSQCSIPGRQKKCSPVKKNTKGREWTDSTAASILSSSQLQRDEKMKSSSSIGLHVFSPHSFGFSCCCPVFRLCIFTQRELSTVEIIYVCLILSSTQAAQCQVEQRERKGKKTKSEALHNEFCYSTVLSVIFSFSQCSSRRS